jgi:epoxide hydrolase A/B
MRQTEDMIFYQLYHQSPDVAEADFERDVRLYIRAALFLHSGERRQEPFDEASSESVGMVPRTGDLLSLLENPMFKPAVMPAWITEADVDVVAAEFLRTGLRGGLNWYRNIDRNWELLAPWTGARVTVPALYLVGDRDLTRAFPGMKELLPNLSKLVPQLRRTLILPRCGHWTQQGRRREVSAMIEFLRHV